MYIDTKIFVVNHIVKIKSVLYDILVFPLLYVIPTVSHITSLPLYLLEPMRLLVIIGLYFTSKTNTYILAVSIPLFSFFVTGHPSFVKSALISTELMVNIFLFTVFCRKELNLLLSLFISILLSKIVYYSIKFLLLSINLLDGELISTNLSLQVLSVVLLTIILYLTKQAQLKKK